MAAVDINAVLGDIAARQVWFKALLLGTLPLQLWVGVGLAVRLSALALRMSVVMRLMCSRQHF
jgi:hypothetical protein